MSTYAQAKARAHATAVYWVEISGIKYAITDGLVPSTTFSAVVGDSSVSSKVVMPFLMEPAQSFSRSIDLHSGKGSVGGFSVAIADANTDEFPEGFGTWLFGSDRADIARTRLTVNVPLHAGGGGHDWTVADATVFPNAPTDIFCELETGQLQTRTAVLCEDVVRSLYHSPATPHKGNVYGVFPEVTDHPTVWAGRIVTFFQSYMDGDGSLCSSDGTAATARAEAHKWRGVLRDVSFRDNAWTLRCDSLDTLLKRQCVRGQPEAIVSRRVDVQKLKAEGDVDIGGAVCAVNLVDPSGVVDQHVYYGTITEGIYTREALVLALNAVWQQGVATDEDGNTNTWEGTLTFAWEADSLSIVYHTSAVAADVRSAVINLGLNVRSADDMENFDTFSYWQAMGVTEANATYITPLDPVADTSYAFSLAAAVASEVDFATHRRRTVLVGPAEPFGGAADASSFSDGDAVAVISSAGVTPCMVRSVDAVNGLIRLRRIVDLDPLGLLHQGTADAPIRVRKAFYAYRGQNELGMAGPGLADPALRLLLSSGLQGYNHDNYDTDDEGIGIAFPHDSMRASASSSEALLDVRAFLDFFGEAEAYVTGVRDFIYEPTEMLGWLQQRVGFLGGFITVINGQLTVRRGIGPLFSDARHTVSEDELLPGWDVQLGQIATIDGVVFSLNWSLPRKTFELNVTAVAGDDTGAPEPQNKLEWKDKGLLSNTTLLQALAHNFLYDFGKENRLYSGNTDRVHWNVEPGQVVRFSDEGTGDTTDDTRLYQGLPNPDGTRGFGAGAQSARMLALSVTTSPDDGTTALRLVHVRSRRSGYSACAWIESFTNVGAAVLTCTAQFFSPTADGVDVSRFAIGDKVRVVRANGTQAGADPGVQTSEGGLTIASINTTANTITLTGVLAVAWVSAVTPIFLMHDPYATASQTDTAKAWCHVGDSSGDINDAGDDCYQW